MGDNSKFSESLKEMSRKDRVLTILRIVTSIAVIAFGLLEIFGIWIGAINVCMPLMGINLAMQAAFYWKSSRSLAIFSLCTAVIIFICAVIVWFS